MRPSLLLAAGILAAALLPQAANAQACAPRQEIVVQLAQKFSETPTAVGVAGNGAILELLTSKSGSWTMLMSFANGAACVIATGENWEITGKQGQET